MYGLEAISAHNGWSMAAVGALIVFSGLLALSFVISQLHNILFFFEKGTHKPDQNKKKIKQEKDDIKKEIKTVHFELDDINKTARVYQSSVKTLGHRFKLVSLYEISQRKNLPHPHLTIRNLRQANLLIPVGNEDFAWNIEDK